MSGTNRRAEERAIEADLAAQELGDSTPPRAALLAPCYVRGRSPEGYDVVFTPGERLPEWAAAALADVDRSDGAPVVDLPKVRVPREKREASTTRAARAVGRRGRQGTPSRKPDAAADAAPKGDGEPS